MDELNKMLDNMVDDNAVVILHTGLPSKKDDVLKSKSDDKTLINNIEEYYIENLKPDNIEVFEKCDNIYITEDGYYLAVYLNDVKKAVDI